MLNFVNDKSLSIWHNLETVFSTVLGKGWVYSATGGTNRMVLGEILDQKTFQKILDINQLWKTQRETP